MMSSMSGKENCFDNAAVETFFKNLKAEMLWRRFCAGAALRQCPAVAHISTYCCPILYYLHS